MQTGLKSISPCPVCAAVIRKTDGPFLMEQLMLKPPRDDEVWVRIVAVAIRRITGEDVDTAMDTTGRVEIIRQMVDTLRSGGRSAAVAVSPPGAKFELDANDLMAGNKSVQGVSQAACVPDIFLPRLIELWRQKGFPFDKIISCYNFDQLNKAVADPDIPQSDTYFYLLALSHLRLRETDADPAMIHFHEWPESAPQPPHSLLCLSVAP